MRASNSHYGKNGVNAYLFARFREDVAEGGQKGSVGGNNVKNNYQPQVPLGLPWFDFGPSL